MPGPSFIKQLRSWRHAFWFGISRRIRWSRGLYREQPAGKLDLKPEEAARVAALKSRYAVQFEQHLGQRSSRINYEYLDLLDCAWTYYGRDHPQGGVVCDVGSASFWYAAALQAFFHPQRLIGVEIEGHRLFRDGRARIDYAAGYVAYLPNTQFMVADYAALELPADIITAWFPFVTQNAILAWRLPLSLLKPAALFSSIKRNLKPRGLFVMVNHGPGEAEVAHECCIAAGLSLDAQFVHSGPLSGYRAVPPVVSCWRRAGRLEEPINRA
jgi:SAM-dependent methyltransferase